MEFQSVSRRAFLTAASAARVLGANERVRLGIIGAGNRGQLLIRELNRLGSAMQIMSVCDVYDRRLEAAVTAARVDGEVQPHTEYRRIIDSSDVDAVVIATPDHWHGQIAMEAATAGKDIYVERPLASFPKDGLSVVRAVRQSKRICQVGATLRSLPQFAEAKSRFVDSKAMGKVGLARTWYNGSPLYTQKAPAGMEKKPEGLNWERWVGPGPKGPWNPEVYFCPHKWLYFGGGMAMGLGVDVIDAAHYLMGLTMPSSAVAMGGTFQFADGRDTADVMSFVLNYPQGVSVTFEGELLSNPRTTAGVTLRGTGGSLTAESSAKDALDFTPADSKRQAQRSAGVEATPYNLLRNWLDCIKSRTRPICNEEDGYYSATACFMANQAFYYKSRIDWAKEWTLGA